MLQPLIVEYLKTPFPTKPYHLLFVEIITGILDNNSLSQNKNTESRHGWG